MDKVCETILHLFKKQMVGKNIELAWISLLDPRFHKMKLFNPDKVQLARECLRD
ncbi:hypothetical protein L914_06640, partial [Phytophthora nicotianae]